MANTSLFASIRGKMLPATDTRNAAGAPAYAYTPRHKLAQLAATGTLQANFYSAAETQLADVLAVAAQVEPLFVAKAAVYARQRGAMKDMPALLAAWLTVADPDLSLRVFRRVVDNGRMLRSYVQILRSGVTGRKSLGSRPKRLVQDWLERAGVQDLMRAATGTAPSLADIVRMVHPRPADAQRRAFYGWLLGKPYDVAALPAEIAAFEAWKRDPSGPLPPVPFEWLTAQPLSPAQWAALADGMGWQALRINLNTLARHGAFAADAGLAARVAARLGDPAALAKARVLPYQLLAALTYLGPEVPAEVRAALERALEAAVSGIPALPGRVAVCPDVSGSMRSPVTGTRKGASSAVRCVDVAGLIASAVLRSNPRARVLPFEVDVVPVTLSAEASVAANAQALAAVGGGGTCVSAPLALLATEKAKVDLVVVVSDNQSWVDARNAAGTATLAEWQRIRARNPQARLVCIDLQPYGTTQAVERADILNVGGFSDAVFDTLRRFASGAPGPDWVGEIEATEV